MSHEMSHERGLGELHRDLAQLERKVLAMDDRIKAVVADVATLKSEVGLISATITALLNKASSLSPDDAAGLDAVHADLGVANAALATLAATPTT